MGGTVSGGKLAAKTNMKNNPNFYREIGRIGGQNGHTGGFQKGAEATRLAGAKGGKISKRGVSNG